MGADGGEWDDDDAMTNGRKASVHDFGERFGEGANGEKLEIVDKFANEVIAIAGYESGWKMGAIWAIAGRVW